MLARTRLLFCAFAVPFLAAPVCATAQTLPTASPAEVGFDAGRLHRIDAVLQGYVSRGQLPGVSVLIARHGKVVYLKSFGSQDIEAHRPMRDDTVVRIYSMSKPISAAATMAAYEEGKFLLSDPVSKYVPELAHMNVYKSGEGDTIKTVPAVRPMTIDNLMTHTAGFTFSFQSSTPVSKLYQKAGLLSGRWLQNDTFHSLDEFAAKLATVPLVHQPGEAWHYGTGFDIAALIIQRTSGESFGKFLHQRILDPLGMADTDFYVPQDKTGRFASLYARGKDGHLVNIEPAKASPFLKPPYVETGSGGLVSTIGDYFKFAQMLCNNGEWNGVRILSPASVDLMLTNHLRPDETGQLTEATGFGFGSAGGGGVGFGDGGAVIEDVGLTGSVGSKGEYTWGGAGSTVFFVDRKRGIVAVLMTQLLPSGTYPLGDVLKASVYQALTAPEL
jgi:CubicO group peptidase (beta-lactamase class C family)